jgi:DNA modification methylase
MENMHDILESVTCSTPVKGLTHNYYRYPARFSPVFARKIIETFSTHGDVVIDPFMGGGTTLVEAYAAGRIAIGTDLNELATYISKVKTSILYPNDISLIKSWTDSLPDNLNFRTKIPKKQGKEYPMNMSLSHTWRIRKILELSLYAIGSLPTKKQQQFAKCAILNTAQWALDCKTHIPSVSEFRNRLYENIHEMIIGMLDLRKNIEGGVNTVKSPLCMCRSAIGIENEKRLHKYASPKLVLTSPPYPGIHVLYHRWQIQGRKETSAPYWISNCMDGNSSSYYTFCDRKQKNLSDYFKRVYESFSSIAKMLNKDSLVVQLVAFSDLTWQLPEYLEALNDAGLKEINFPQLSNSNDGRVWRNVPNRKWYTTSKGDIPSSKEVVLFHRLY